jgi:Arc/MetJ-type ribon-helix-helix transcriptional regulator
VRIGGAPRSLEPRTVRRKFYLSEREDAGLSELVDDYGSRSRAIRAAVVILQSLSKRERRLLEERAGWRS